MKLVLSPEIYPVTFIIQGGSRDFDWMMESLLEKKVPPKSIKEQMEDLATGDQMDKTAGFRCDFGSVQYIWVRDKLTWRTVDTYVHEILHGVWGCMEFLEIDDQEAWCYLMDYLIREVSKTKVKISKEKA